MQLENIATPPHSPTPQMRYASLHRTVERGMASDEVWNELARVCLELKLNDEAIRAFGNMSAGALKNSLESLLTKRGALAADTKSELPGQQKDVSQELPEQPTLKDHLIDAFNFLFQGHMPLTLIVATVTFPLVVGLGGFLTAGTSMFLLPAIALLPGLSAVGIVGAMGRRILIDASRGLEDAPELPEVKDLFAEAGRFLLDVTLLMTLLVGPGVALLSLGLPVWLSLPTLICGLLTLPIAIAVRQLTNDWRILSLKMMLRSTICGGREYLSLAVVVTALFLPAALAGILTFGSAPHLQIAVIGPLLVLPSFLAARMLGTFVDTHRGRLGHLLTVEQANPQPAEVEPSKPAPVAEKSAKRPEPAPKPKREEPTARPAAAANATRKTVRKRPARQRLDAPSHPEARRQSPAAARPNLPPKPEPAKPAKANRPKPVTEPSRRKDAQRPKPEAPSRPTVATRSPLAPADQQELPDLPELANMPGVRVVTGADRDRMGASSQRRS